MVVFLTSSPTGPFGGENRRIVNGLDELNGFVRRLRDFWLPDSRCLMVCASPANFDGNDEMTAYFGSVFQEKGLTISRFDLWDDRTETFSKEVLHGYDVIFLAGGHVPTQNHFFEKIHLREMIQGFDGIVIGISAGTMNSAGEVYAQPEEPGESVDPGYQRYYRGLGLTQINVLPHYQMVKDSWLDGRRLMEDITYQDSYGRKFCTLVDGSYILIREEEGRHKTTLYGEAYLISDGGIRQLCLEGEELDLSDRW